MARLREANIKHSQYATAMEHLRHIYNIPEIVEKTHEFIVEGKLLHAHKKYVLSFWVILWWGDDYLGGEGW